MYNMEYIKDKNYRYLIKNTKKYLFKKKIFGIVLI